MMNLKILTRIMKHFHLVWLFSGEKNLRLSKDQRKGKILAAKGFNLDIWKIMGWLTWWMLKFQLWNLNWCKSICILFKTINLIDFYVSNSCKGHTRLFALTIYVSYKLYVCCLVLNRTAGLISKSWKSAATFYKLLTRVFCLWFLPWSIRPQMQGE